MENKNYLKFIIPVVAVLVVAESIVLVGNLNNRQVPVISDTAKSGTLVSQPTRAMAPLEIAIKSDLTTVTVGKVGQARVEILPRVAKAVDGVSLFVKFDPTMVKISDLVFNPDMPKPIVGKVAKSGDMMVVNYLISAKDGYVLVAGQPTNLLTFNYQPIKAGVVSFDLLTSNESKDSATMVVENGSSISLSFETKNLMIKAQGKQ